MFVLYPAYSFETVSLGDGESNELLSAYSALFHPAILEAVGTVPTWESAFYPTSYDTTRLVVIPPCCENSLDPDWAERQAGLGTLVVRNLREREEIVAFILGHEKFTAFGGHADREFDAERIADFTALGTAAFLTDLLTRQLRYMSMLDNTKLSEAALDAVRAVREGNEETFHDRIGKAFSLVSEAKEYFYPAKTYLLNLLLLTERDRLETIAPHLDPARKTTLLLPSRLLRMFADREPELLAALRSALASESIGLIGGDDGEEALFLLPPDAIADRLRDGIDTYTELLDRRPFIYGRTRTGFTPVLPQLLKQAGFRGAVHYAPLDGWKIEEEKQSVQVWQGIDGTQCDALIRYPTNAADNDDYVDLATRLGRIIDTDRAATIVFAHFPGQTTRWLDDLLRMDRYAPALGEFLRIDDYFAKIEGVGEVRRYGFGKYQADELYRSTDAAEPEPISRWTRFFQERATERLDGALAALASIADPHRTEKARRPSLETLARAITGGDTRGGKGMLVINPLCTPRTAFLDVSHFEHLPAEDGYVQLAREFKRAGSETPVKEIAVRVPPMGYRWIPDAPPESESNADEKTGNRGTAAPGFLERVGALLTGKKIQPKSEPPLAYRASIALDGGASEVFYMLRNEHCELKIDAHTGAFLSLRIPGERGNRLAVQIAMRLPKDERNRDERPDDHPGFGYTIMAADEIAIESPGPLEGRLRITGRLMHPDGRLAARFTLRPSIRRISRLIGVDLDLQPAIDSSGNPWDSYYAVRWAWGDEMLALQGGVHEGRFPIENPAEHVGARLQLPEFVDLRNGTDSLTLFTPGLPFHRRFGIRLLDTLLISGGDPGRRFRFAFGVNTDDPVAAMHEFQLPPESELAVRSAAPKNPAAWLYFIEAKNVGCLRWVVADTPVADAVDGTDAADTLRIRATLLETEGKAARFRLRCCRAVREAFRLDLLGAPDREKPLEIDDGDVVLKMHRYELLSLELRFAVS